MTTMPDQATALRRLARDAAPGAAHKETSQTQGAAVRGVSSLTTRTTVPAGAEGRVRGGASVIAVTSGKGGVGKSNVAVNLAVRFAASGKRVLLLDADLGLANADVLCGVEVPFNLSHVVARRRTAREVVVRVAVGGAEFDLVGGASGLARMADLDEGGRRQLLEALSELERSADVVLIDTGAGISSNVLAFCRAADHVLVVTTPEPTAVTDAYALIKTITPPAPVTANGAFAAISGDGLLPAGAPGTGRKVSLLVNQVASQAEGRAVYERVSRVARQFLGTNVLDAGHVVWDESVTRAVRKRTPLVVHAPGSEASRCLTQLAARLEQGVARGGLRGVSGPNNSGGFFRRLARRVVGKG